MNLMCYLKSDILSKEFEIRFNTESKIKHIYTKDIDGLMNPSREVKMNKTLPKYLEQLSNPKKNYNRIIKTHRSVGST